MLLKTTLARIYKNTITEVSEHVRSQQQSFGTYGDVYGHTLLPSSSPRVRRRVASLLLSTPEGLNRKVI